MLTFSLSMCTCVFVCCLTHLGEVDHVELTKNDNKHMYDSLTSYFFHFLIILNALILVQCDMILYLHAIYIASLEAYISCYTFMNFKSLDFHMLI